MSVDLAEPLALVVITLAIVYVSLVLGELAPKRLALQRAEGVATVVAPPLDRFASLMRPVIWLLSRSTDVVVRLLGGDPGIGRAEITEEELRDLLSGHEALSEEERKIVEDVFAAADRQVREVMRPRTEVDFLDAALPVYQAVKMASDLPHSRYPVVRGSSDDVVGFVHVRDLFAPDIANRSVRVGELVREIILLRDQAPAPGAVGDAASGRSHRRRRRRIRRNSRNRHARRSRGGTRRRHPGRVRRFR